MSVSKDIEPHFKSFKDAGKFSSELIERVAYSHDLAPLPEFVRFLFDTLPDAIIQPQSPEEVVEIMSIAKREKIPIIPRGAGTSGFGGVLPTKGGLIVETVRLNKVIVDEERRVATVGSGARWLDVMREAEKKGLAVMTYPSSAPSATVGGWVSSGGIGIGTLRHGDLKHQLQAIEVALPSGELIKVNKSAEFPSLDLFMGSEGILGIITSAEIALYPKPCCFEAFFVCFSKIDDLYNAILEIFSRNLLPYYIEILSPSMLRLEQELGHYSRCNGWCSLFVFEDYSPLMSHEKELEEIAVKFGGINYGRELGEEAWNRRFKTMEIKSLGPTLLGNEAIIPLARVRDVNDRLEKLQRKFDVKMGIHYIPISTKECLVMPMILANERRPLSYLLALALSVQVLREAISVGGKPYGYGLWNAPYARKSLPPEFLEKIGEFKRKVDPEYIMNPGKLLEAKTRFGFPLSGWHLSLLVFFAYALNAYKKVFKREL